MFRHVRLKLKNKSQQKVYFKQSFSTHHQALIQYTFSFSKYNSRFSSPFNIIYRRFHLLRFPLIKNKIKMSK